MMHLPAVLLALLMVAGLFYGGSQPVAVGLFAHPWDKLVHAGTFAVLTLLVIACRRQARWTWVLISTLAAVSVGAADELHQHFLPGREADLADLAADMFGAVAGACVAACWRWVWQKQNPKL